MPAFHYSLHVCIFRTCHGLEENTQELRVSFFLALSIFFLSPSLSPSCFLAHSKGLTKKASLYLLITIKGKLRTTAAMQPMWTQTRKCAAAAQQRRRRAVHRPPLCPACKG